MTGEPLRSPWSRDKLLMRELKRLNWHTNESQQQVTPPQEENFDYCVVLSLSRRGGENLGSGGDMKQWRHRCWPEPDASTPPTPPPPLILCEAYKRMASVEQCMSDLNHQRDIWVLFGMQRCVACGHHCVWLAGIKNERGARSVCKV